MEHIIQPKTALVMLKERANNPWRLPLLLLSENEHFDLRLGVTEIVGAAGCGKTQMALSTCVNCACNQRREQINDNSFGKAIYVSMGEGTTKQMIARRLDQISRYRISKNSTKNQTAKSILNRIITRFVPNQDEFEQFILYDLPSFLQTDSAVGLIVLDSIASMFRTDEMNDELFAVNRSSLLFQLSAQLKKLSEVHNIPIVVINQVTGDFSMSETLSRPALGLSWENCVNQSFLLTRREVIKNDSHAKGNGYNTVTRFQRSIICRLSSTYHTVEAGFVIDDAGATILL